MTRRKTLPVVTNLDINLTDDERREEQRRDDLAEITTEKLARATPDDSYFRVYEGMHERIKVPQWMRDETPSSISVERPLRVAGLVKLPDSVMGRAWLMSRASAGSVMEGRHCGHCLEPQSDTWTTFCRRRRGTEMSCGFLRGSAAFDAGLVLVAV